VIFVSRPNSNCQGCPFFSLHLKSGFCGVIIFEILRALIFNATWKKDVFLFFPLFWWVCFYDVWMMLHTVLMMLLIVWMMLHIVWFMLHIVWMMLCFIQIMLCSVWMMLYIDWMMLCFVWLMLCMHCLGCVIVNTQRTVLCCQIEKMFFWICDTCLH